MKLFNKGSIPRSNLILSKSVRRLLALPVTHDFLMDADGSRIWAHPNTQWNVHATLVGEICDALWVMAGMGATKGLHSRETYVA